MRLDHLLSREKTQREIRGFIPRSMPKEEIPSVKEEPLGSQTIIASVPMSLYHFQGSQNGEPWGFSSAGRAPALQAGGQRFDPANLHHVWIASSAG